MWNWRLWIGITLVAAVAGIAWVSAQGRRDAHTLTGADIAEIERLYARYNQGLDFQDEELYLSAWADDAVFTTGGGEVWKGREGLRARFRQRPGAEGRTISHNNTSILVTGTAEGAKGRGYWIVIDTSANPPRISGHGHYFDTFVRTPNGWRIKTRGSMRGWSETRWVTESKSTPF
mgnify:CR=1 FL=1